jgi:alpha-N-arabinofuranosidase
MRARLESRPRFVVPILAMLMLAGSCQNTGDMDPTQPGNGSSAGREARGECGPSTDPIVGRLRKNPISPEPADTEIVIDASSVQGSVHPGVFGVNHRYPYSGFDMWDSGEDATYPLFAERFEYAGFTEVRFPGGRTANNYHWQRSIGPVEERGLHVDAAFGRIPAYSEPLTSEFGVDEFGRFLEEVGAQGTMVVNFATGSAHEAANWVEYMNTPVGQNPRGGKAWAGIRAENGHPEPYDVSHWEIGNELAGAKTFWLGRDSTEKEAVEKYAFGGETAFEKDRAVGLVDYSPGASLSNGKPGQQFFVRFPPIKPGSDKVYVGEEWWKRIDSLSKAGPDDKVYEIDFRRGMISFGDGERGAIPPVKAPIAITHVSGPHDGFIDFYRQMKQVDRDIEVGSAFNSPQFLQTMGTIHPFDFFVIHSYSFFGADPTNMGEFHDLMMKLPEGQAGRVAAAKEGVFRYAGDRAADIGIVVSEWAMSTGSNLGIRQLDFVPLEYPMTLDGAIYIALMLRHWIELDIEVAQKHSLIDVNPSSLPPGYDKGKTAYQALIGPYPCFVLTPSALVFKLFKEMTGRQLVASDVLGNPTKTIFTGEQLSALEVVASRDSEGRLYLIVINKSRDQAVPAAVRTTGFQGSGRATVWSITARDALAINTDRLPNRVRIKEAELKGVRSRFTYLFPRRSVTGFRVEG